MAKTTKDETITSPEDNTTQKYIGEFNTWREDLRPFWKQIDKNQQMYEFYKSEGSETSSDISLNTTFSIIESIIAKANESTLSVTVKAKGNNETQQFEEYVSGVLKDAIEDPDVAYIKGTFRKKKEQFIREFLVKGNAFAEMNYCYMTGIVNGDKKVLADNPYITILPYKSVIFNPSKQADASNVYYIEKHVSWSELKTSEYDKKTGKGIYSNLSSLKNKIDTTGKLSDDTDVKYVSGNQQITKKNESIHILERWEGAKLIVIANKDTIIREVYDPFKIGGHPLLIGMNYVIEGRPYAYGEIDPIYKPVRAQDTIVNQNIEIINKYLRDGYAIGPNIDIDAFIQVLESGGVVSVGDTKDISVIPHNVPPQQAFMQIDNIQQAIERAARFSPYSAGIPNQATDKTSGTATGINSMQRASEPNFQIKLDAVEECLMQPLGRMYLRCIGNLMGEDEIRYTILRGKSNEWASATKGMLTGKATLDDLVTVGYLNKEKVDLLLQLQSVDENGMPEIDVNGEPVPKYSKGMKTIAFDVDWVIDVKLDNQSKADKERDTQVKMAWMQFAMQVGAQFDPDKITELVSLIGREQGIEDPEQYFLTAEQKQQQMMEQEQMQVQQQQQSQQQQQMQDQQNMEIEMAKKKAELDAQMQQKQLEHQSKYSIAQLQANSRMQPVVTGGYNGI